MKAFFEEYGLAVVTAFVIIILLSVSKNLGDVVDADASGIMGNFSEKLTDRIVEYNLQP